MLNGTLCAKECEVHLIITHEYFSEHIFSLAHSTYFIRRQKCPSITCWARHSGIVRRRRLVPVLSLRATKPAKRDPPAWFESN